MNTTLFYKTFVTLLIINVIFNMYAIVKEGLKMPHVVFLPLFAIMLVIYIWFPLQSFFKKDEK